MIKTGHLDNGTSNGYQVDMPYYERMCHWVTVCNLWLSCNKLLVVLLTGVNKDGRMIIDSCLNFLSDCRDTWIMSALKGLYHIRETIGSGEFKHCDIFVLRWKLMIMIVILQSFWVPGAQDPRPLEIEWDPCEILPKLQNLEFLCPEGSSKICLRPLGITIVSAPRPLTKNVNWKPCIECFYGLQTHVK